MHSSFLCMFIAILRIEINTHEKELCLKLVIYKDYTEMHGQQNVWFLICLVQIQRIVRFFLIIRNSVYCSAGVCFIFSIQNQKSVGNGCNLYFNSIIILIMWIYAWNFVCYNFMVMSVLKLVIDFFFYSSAPLFTVKEGIYIWFINNAEHNPAWGHE
jgi:hypothetical protein